MCVCMYVYVCMLDLSHHSVENYGEISQLIQLGNSHRYAACITCTMMTGDILTYTYLHTHAYICTHIHTYIQSYGIY